VAALIPENEVELFNNFMFWDKAKTAIVN